MLTDAQWTQIGAIFADSGRSVRMLASDAYIIVDSNHRRISRDEYTSHAAAALALIGGTYTQAAQRVETCVQHGAKNRPQWAKAKPQPVTQL